MPTNKKPTAEQLIADVKKIHSKYPNAKITREFYRAHSKFTSWDVENHFGTFEAFRQEAGVEVATEKTQPESQVVAGDLWSITLPKTRVHTLPELIEKFKVDESIWECVKFQAVAHEMGYATGPKAHRKGKVLPLFNIRADFKKKKDVLFAKQEIQDIISQAKEEIKKVPSKQTIYLEQDMSGNLLEVSLPDVHFGKLARGAETGYGNYDTKIAEATYERAIDALIFRAKGYRYDKVLFIVGNDLLQSDDEENRTTSGTIVSTDGRYHKTFRTARRAVIRAIEKLRQLAPVDVIMVPGNHDERSTWHLGESLDIYFDRYDDVTIENEPKPRKYYQFGSVGWMFLHGHKGKKNDYPLLFATERPDIFGTSMFREIHCGHTHETKLDEKHGVRTRVLPSLCQEDDWHSVMGLTGNLKSAEAQVWNRNEGMIAQFFFNDDAHPKINTVTSIQVG